MAHTPDITPDISAALDELAAARAAKEEAQRRVWLAVTEVVRLCDNNQSAAARVLGCKPSVVAAMMAKLRAAQDVS